MNCAVRKSFTFWHKCTIRCSVLNIRPNLIKNRWGWNINQESPTFSDVHNVAVREWRVLQASTPNTNLPWHGHFDHINARFSAMTKLSAFFQRHASHYMRAEQFTWVAVNRRIWRKVNAATRLLLCARTPRRLPVRPPWSCCWCRWPRASSGYKAGSQGTLAHARTTARERAMGRGQAHAPRTRKKQRHIKSSNEINTLKRI